MAIAWRGPGAWHWRHYGQDYVAQAGADGWRVRISGNDYAFRRLDGWLPAGSDIHILLSGPSIATIREPALLSRQPTITVNGSYRILEGSGGRADLYLVSDVGFVRRQWPALLAGVRCARALAVDHRVALEIARHDRQLLHSLPVYLFDNLTRPYRQSAHWWRRFPATQLPAEGRRCAFSQDARIGFFPSRTVAYLALQIAAAQHPRRIVLFGLDLGGAGRYYSENAPERSMLARDFAEYIVPDFRFAANLLRAQGVEVLNASPDSALPASVLPRVDPNEWLREPPPGLARSA